LKWFKARKKPVVVLVREVEPKEDFSANVPRCTRSSKGETIATREGNLIAICGRDFIVKGVEGELYPIDKKIFYKTYEILGESAS
jgi:hypothetical protein